ncbi:glycosyltransferase family 2 protein [Candidatus Parcubacteria bacterium]|nr:MAG: glycosyltransferase family 2 protein [Candidatus Parcubacteria bacterium]
MPKLSIIIPAYNEEKRLPTTLQSVSDYLKKQNYSWEVIVADNASTDGTGRIAEEWSKKDKAFKHLVVHEAGKGATIKRAMERAVGEYRLFMDADNATTLDHIEFFWPHLEGGYDVVIGSIEVAGSTIEEKAGWHRRFLGKLAKLIIRFVALPGIMDSQRGFKCFSKRSAEIVFKKQTIGRWGFDIEILLISRRNGFKIKEVPVQWKNLGESKVTLGAYVSTFIDLFKIKLNDLAGKYKA